MNWNDNNWFNALAILYICGLGKQLTNIMHQKYECISALPCFLACAKLEGGSSPPGLVPSSYLGHSSVNWSSVGLKDQSFNIPGIVGLLKCTLLRAVSILQLVSTQLQAPEYKIPLLPNITVTLTLHVFSCSLLHFQLTQLLFHHSIRKSLGGLNYGLSCLVFCLILFRSDYLKRLKTSSPTLLTISELLSSPLHVLFSPLSFSSTPTFHHDSSKGQIS